VRAGKRKIGRGCLRETEMNGFAFFANLKNTYRYALCCVGLAIFVLVGFNRESL